MLCSPISPHPRAPPPKKRKTKQKRNVQMLIDTHFGNDTHLHIKYIPGNVADGVAPPAEHEHRHSEALYVLHGLRMALERKVEAPQTVTRQRVGATLQHHG